MKRVFRSFSEIAPLGDYEEYRLTAEFFNDDDSLIRNTPEFPTIFTATYRVSRTMKMTQSTLRDHIEEKLRHEVNAKMDEALLRYSKPIHPLKTWLEAHR